MECGNLKRQFNLLCHNTVPVFQRKNLSEWVAKKMNSPDQLTGTNHLHTYSVLHFISVVLFSNIMIKGIGTNNRLYQLWKTGLVITARTDSTSDLKASQQCLPSTREFFFSFIHSQLLCWQVSLRSLPQVLAQISNVLLLWLCLFTHL